MDFHDRAVDCLCHCCGKKIKEKDKKYYVDKTNVASITTIKEKKEERVHFNSICVTCYGKFLSGDAIEPLELREHTATSCLACYLLRQQLKSGSKIKSFRYPNSRNHTNGQFSSEEHCVTLNQQFTIFNEDDKIYECSICTNLLSTESIQTPCQHFFCRLCITKLFKAVGRTCIPCFSCTQGITQDELKDVPVIIKQTLKNVPLKCKICNDKLIFPETISHKCRSMKEQAYSTIVNAVKEIEEKSKDVCPKELKDMAHKLVKKDLVDGKMSLKTQGRPLKMVVEAKCPTPTMHVCHEPQQINPQKCLAIMNACKINWNQQRALRRYCPGLFASERQMRAHQDEIVGEFLVRSLEYMFVKRDGATSIGGLALEEVAVVRLKNIKQLIFDYLNQYDMSDELNFHNGEIFVKFGGDKGGDTTKFEVQLCCLDKPNALHNVIVVLVFQAPDLTVNIEKGLSLVLDEVMDLDGSKWTSQKSKITYNIRLFFFGDYDFLCRIYGLVGPNGKYSCIYCYANQDNIRSNAAPARNRTLISYNKDYKSFVDNRADQKKSKNVSYSVVRPYMIDIELNRVSIPALHISFGLFKKLYDMLERDIHNLDVIIFNMRQDSATIPSGDNLEDFDRKVAEAAAHRLSCVEKIQSLNDTLDELRNNLSFALVDNNRNADEIAELGNSINLKEQQVKELQTSMNQELKFASGPLATKMDTILRENKIPRQQYHGKSFVGNHVHQACKCNIIEKLMNGVETTLKQQIYQSPSNCKKLLEVKFCKIKESFTPVFTTFADIRCIDDTEIDSYDHYIKLFSKEYRRIAPGVIQPKLHMLEHHTIAFMREWKVGVGLLAEQGGELIHAEFNRRKRSVQGLRSNLDQLMSIMKAHLTFTSPKIQKEIIRPKRLKKAEE